MSHISIIPVIADNVINRIAVFAGGKQVIFNAFAPGYNTTVYQAEKAIQKINGLIDAAANGGHKVLVYNWRNWLRASRKYVKNIAMWHCDRIFDPVNEIKAESIEQLVEEVVKIKPAAWMSTYANAALTYEWMENTPILIDGFRAYSHWNYDSYSGRSKSSERPLQNLAEGTHVADPLNMERDRVITVDWKAADLIIAAYLAGDQELVNKIIDGDIYKEFQDNADDRQDTKRAILSSLYRADDSTLAAVSVKLAQWTAEQIETVKLNNSVVSYFGRTYTATESGSRSILSAFNAQIQGTIALAMMHILPRVQVVPGASLLFETHDAVTVVARQEITPSVIKRVCEIMYQPFRGMNINGLEVRMPVTFSCGKLYGVKTISGEYRDGKLKMMKGTT